jgi:urease gamma subunit
MEESDKAKAFDVLVEAFGLKMGTYDDMVAEVTNVRVRSLEWKRIANELASAKVAHPVYPHSVLEGVRHLITSLEVRQQFIDGMRKILGLRERADSIGIDELRAVHNLKAEVADLKTERGGNVHAISDLHKEMCKLWEELRIVREEFRLKSHYLGKW